MKQRGGSEQGRAAEEKARFENKAQALRPNLNVRFATGAPKQKRTLLSRPQRCALLIGRVDLFAEMS